MPVYVCRNVYSGGRWARTILRARCHHRGTIFFRELGYIGPAKQFQYTFGLIGAPVKRDFNYNMQNLFTAVSHFLGFICYLFVLFHRLIITRTYYGRLCMLCVCVCSCLCKGLSSFGIQDPVLVTKMIKNYSILNDLLFTFLHHFPRITSFQNRYRTVKASSDQGWVSKPLKDILIFRAFWRAEIYRRRRVFSFKSAVISVFPNQRMDCKFYCNSWQLIENIFRKWETVFFYSFRTKISSAGPVYSYLAPHPISTNSPT